MDKRSVASGVLFSIAMWMASGAAQAAGCEVDPQQGLPPTPPPSSGCTSPAQEFIAATPALIGSVVKQCTVLSAATSLGAAQAAVSAKVIEIQTKIATTCASLPGTSQFVCQVALLSGSLGVEAAECVTRGLVEGAPVSERNRTIVRTVVDAVFGLKSRAGFASDANKFSSGGMSDANRAKFIEDLAKTWEEVAAVKFGESLSSFVAFFNQDAAVANALADAEQQATACNLPGTDAAVARAIEISRKNIVEARLATRDSEREMECIRKIWIRDLGPGWQARVEAGEGGPAVESFNQYQRQAANLRATEPTRLAELARAGTICAAVQQLRPQVEQGRASYEAARLQARDILLGSSCDLALADQYLALMESYETNPCKGPLTNTPAEFIARGAPFASVALRGELGRRRAQCETVAVPQTPPPPFVQPTISIAGTWNSNLGYVYEIAQTGMSFTWVVSNQPGLNENGKGSLTEAGKINASWTNARGTDGKADGTVFALDSNGRATRITWSNGVSFDRN